MTKFYKGDIILNDYNKEGIYYTSLWAQELNGVCVNKIEAHGFVLWYRPLKNWIKYIIDIIKIKKAKN
jgi:hypothetical protein